MPELRRVHTDHAPAAIGPYSQAIVTDGWVFCSGQIPLDPDTEEQYRRAIDVLKGLGAEVVEDPFAGTGFVDLYDEQPRVPTQGAHDMLVYMQGLGPGAPFDSIEEWEMLSGRPYTRGQGRGDAPPPAPARPSATEEGDAYQAWRHAIRNLFRGVLREHRLDGLFFPQSGVPSRPVVEDPERPDYAPSGWFEDGTPFVVAFVGDSWTEAELLGYAYRFEQATRARRPPTLSDPPTN